MAMTSDRLVELLSDAANRHDFGTYASLVANNPTVIQSIESDFWREIFSIGSDDEISFWVNTPNRRLTIDNLSLLGPEKEDLFQRGLAREDLDLTDVDDILGIMTENESEYTGADLARMRARHAQIMAMIQTDCI